MNLLKREPNSNGIKAGKPCCDYKCSLSQHLVPFFKGRGEDGAYWKRKFSLVIIGNQAAWGLHALSHLIHHFIFISTTHRKMKSQETSDSHPWCCGQTHSQDDGCVLITSQLPTEKTFLGITEVFNSSVINPFENLNQTFLGIMCVFTYLN